MQIPAPRLFSSLFVTVTALVGLDGTLSSNGCASPSFMFISPEESISNNNNNNDNNNDSNNDDNNNDHNNNDNNNNKKKEKKKLK